MRGESAREGWVGRATPRVWENAPPIEENVSIIHPNVLWVSAFGTYTRRGLGEWSPQALDKRSGMRSACSRGGPRRPPFSHRAGIPMH